MAHPNQVIGEGDRPSSRGPFMANQAGATNAAYSSYCVGGNVAETQPPERVVVEGENQAHAVNTPLVSFKPIVLRPEDPGYDLDFWPTILGIRPTMALVTLYLGTALGIGMLYWNCLKVGGQFQVSSENVHMIARYFPSILGTVNVILFRQTVQEFIRMTPYVNMADQVNRHWLGAIPWKSVSGAFFPWQDITISHRPMAILSLLCQIGASFIVSLKVVLFATVKHANGSWSLTVRVYPALILILGHCIMAGYTLLVVYLYKGKSTGLKWDPTSVADYVALFAKCNAMKYFELLELRHERSARDLISPEQRFRLGYWNKETRDRQDPTRTVKEKVYGIGTGFNAEKDEMLVTTIAPERHWYRLWIPGKQLRDPTPMAAHNEHCKKKKMGRTPCEHYPFRHNPGCARWLLILTTLIIWAALGASIFALVRGWPFSGFWLHNDWNLPSNLTVIVDGHNYTAPPIDPNDPKSTLLAYALVFRSAPTYVATLFTSTIIESLDLNMRFMQPFVNMLQEPADADATVLLAYITLSPVQVPLTAYARQDYNVCWYSTLNTLSPLFPIFVGGLLTVTSGETKYPQRVDFSFSLTAYIGIMVFLVVYAISVPGAFPHPHRLLPRQFYSLADLMAFCHQARFLGSPHLDIHNRERTPTKEHMEARIRLSGDKFLFGKYKGIDNQWHMGFDVEETRGQDYSYGPLRKYGLVDPIPPEGYHWLLRERVKAQTIRVATRIGTFFGGGLGDAPHPVHTGDLAQRARQVHDSGAYEMRPTPQQSAASSSGFNVPGPSSPTEAPTIRPSVARRPVPSLAQEAIT